ncbi:MULTISPECIES: ABC transporter ATP-binding protein [Metallosphaera]|uniref:ABC transporter ATP-binding protein n=2 Tax=Sulfolobaceae TaxID=118883 RepID=UPI001F063543|nr:ABC transporter ATP-binding protein [Metallosphaera sedula]
MSVELRQVSKRYGKVQAVKGVNLKVEKGEFFVLLGTSGSGKTTILRSIAGLETIDEGEILIDNERVHHLPPGRRNVAMVFQNFALYPHKTVYENLSLPIENLDKGERDERINEISKRLDIHHLLERYPAELSGGQQQRVALARALVKRPKVFLMDEPLSNIDVPKRVAARDLIKEIQREESITTIYVTHDQTEAMALADRIGVMLNGELRQVGHPEDIYLNPNCVDVATFFGMSVVDGGLVKESGKVGVLPEHVDLGKGPYKGVVRNVEFAGNSYMVHLSVNGDRLRALSKVRPRIGEEVEFAITRYKVLGS